MSGSGQGATQASRAALADAIRLFAAGDYAAAEAATRARADAVPADGAAWKILAASLGMLGRKDEALAAARRAVALLPSDPEAWRNLAALQLPAGDREGGAASLAEAARLSPRDWLSRRQLGAALRELGRLDAAEASYRDALALAPDDTECNHGLGVVLQLQGRPALSIPFERAAIAAAPQRAAPWKNLGAALEQLGDVDAALEAIDRALALDPGDSGSHSIRSVTLLADGRLAEGLEGFERAIALDPANAEARWNRALALLSAGRLGEGWRDYEFRWQAGTVRAPRASARPPWRGDTPIAGRTVLLWGEQGFGDQLQFLRYAPLVTALGARVLLEVEPALLRLVQGLEGVAAVASAEAGFSDRDFDLHCPLLSLPLAFDTGLADIPARVPYLAPPVQVLERWRGRLGDAGGRPRIGIAWSGSTSHRNDRNRSVALARLASLFGDGAEWISLQRELRAEDRDAFARIGTLRHFGDELRDFADTAALCALCDLVVSVDTSVAHLAGALGRPLWILLPFAADWRWLTDRSDSPWYPTARLYRQDRRGDWDGALTRLGRDLATWIAARATVPAAPDRGVALMQAGRAQDALAEFDAAVTARPDDAGAWSNRGAALIALAREDAALDSLERALALDPGSAEAHSNRGLLLVRRGRLDAALDSARRAVALRPDWSVGLCTLGLALRRLGRLDEAREAYARAVACDPADGRARNNLALATLAAGDLERGWRLHEDRWLRAGAEPYRRTARPEWRGAEDPAGRTLLLSGEQGFGDQIQFVRYAPLVAARGARVVLEVAAPLVRLFAGVDGVTGVAATGAALADAHFDLHCPLMSLPLAFATRLETIPSRIPYLRAPPAARAAWADALGGDRRPVIGIAWSGNATHSGDRARSLALARLAHLLDARACWVSLQRDVRAEDRETLAQLPGLRHFGERLDDFADTAALIERCDLVVAVDTSVAHLAGALGRPVWILLPFAADWRWLTARADSPWYPTARLYRQQLPGDWQDVLARVGADLQAWFAVRETPSAAPARSRQDVLLELYRAGDLEAAQRAADAWLAAEPDAPLALKMRGVLLARRRQFEPAYAAMERATAAAPRDAEAWRHLATIAQHLGRMEAAENAFRRALDLEPGNAEAQAGLGRVLQQGGRPAEAAERLRAAIGLSPGSADLANDLAAALVSLDQLDEAEASLRAAIALRPDHAIAHANLAALLRRRGRLDAAVEAQAKAVALSPGAAAPLAALADMLCLARRHAQALESYDRALALQPEDATVQGNRGLALKQLGRTAEALAAFERAIALRPDLADAHANRGLLLRELGRAEEGRANLEAAVALAPGSPGAHVNLGLALRDLGHPDAALASYNRAIALAPGVALPRWNKGLVLLAEGRLEEGWPLYERRWRDASQPDASTDLALIWQREDTDPQRRTARPAWRGDGALDGRTILLWREQGFGDQIQFARYAGMVAARGARVLLEVDRPLLRLMQGLAGVDAIAAADTPFADDAFDLQCPLMSLPLAFATRLDTIPATVPYLRVPEAATARWGPALGPARRPRVGIAWSGHPGHTEDGRRSMALALLAPLFDARVEWISLQRDVRAADQAVLEGVAGLRHFGTRLEDFADTAALCAQCDLMIAVDTSVAHLAGALARPVWILLPWVADWRWLKDRSDNPWYPTATLYRQERSGDWDGVLARVGRDLQAWLAMRGGS
jgi:tetratricopeptide (TPR) repeat protein